MKYWMLLLIVALATGESGIREVNPVVLREIEEETRNTEDFYIVLFYASWCRHCRDYWPIYEEAAKKLPVKFPRLHFVSIEAYRHRGELKAYGIRVYPTIKLLIKGSYSQLYGDRNVDDLENFVIKKKLLM